MAEATLGSGIWTFHHTTKGGPVALGKVFVGQPDLDPEILANRVNVTIIQEDGTRVVIQPDSQPLTLGAGGKVVDQTGSAVVVKVSDTVAVKVLDANNVQVDFIPFYNESVTADLNERVAPVNGSFENETAQAGTPDNWTLSPSSGGTIATDTDSSHGLKALKFTGTDATGSGAATSELFNVLESSNIDVRFSYKSSAVDTLTKVDINYYNSSLSLIVTNTIFSDAATNPLTYTSFLIGETTPAAAVRAEINLTGLDAAGATTIGTALFDAVSITEIIENSVLRTVNVSSAVNEITVTNAAAGNAVVIAATGGDSDIGLNLAPKGTKEATYLGARIQRIYSPAAVTLNGHSTEFLNIPDWARVITVSLHLARANNVSGPFIPLIQFGTSSGLETSGYIGTADRSPYTSLDSLLNGFPVSSNLLAENNTISGICTFTKVLGNQWVSTTIMTKGPTNDTLYSGAGQITLPATLDRLALIAATSPEIFGAGSMSVVVTG